jgi:hypothetical protein
VPTLASEIRPAEINLEQPIHVILLTGRFWPKVAVLTGFRDQAYKRFVDI